MFLRYNLFNITWAFFVLALTLMPGASMPMTNIWDLFKFDNFAHVFVFFVLTFLTIIGLRKQYTFRVCRFKAVQLGVSVCILYGLALEVIQGLVPGRTLEIQDMIANTLGCFVGWGLYFMIYHRCELK